jgi:hypothetical protein
MQPKVTTTAEGAAAEGEAAAAAMAAGSARPPLLLVLWRVGIITAQREVKARKLQWALFASFATHMAPRTGLPDPPLILFSSSTRPSAIFLDST